MLRFFLSLIAIVLALAVARPSAAAQPRPDLVVTLRDSAGAGVSRVLVEVRDLADGATLARETTDVTGTAVFPTLPVSAVRVVVQGQLADRTPLTQPGQDEGGIAFYGGAASNRLDLRVEANGTVLPDPLTMLAPDVGVDAATPTGALPTTAATPTAPAGAVVPPTVAPVIPVDMNDTPLADAPANLPFGWLLVCVLSCALLAVIVLLLRRGA